MCGARGARGPPSSNQDAAPHIPPPRCLCVPLSLSWSCYLNSSDFQGEMQQPPRRALQSDGFWGQTGWRPPYVIGGEKELEVTVTLINVLAWGMRLNCLG